MPPAPCDLLSPEAARTLASPSLTEQRNALGERLYTCKYREDNVNKEMLLSARELIIHYTSGKEGVTASVPLMFGLQFMYAEDIKSNRELHQGKLDPKPAYSKTKPKAVAPPAEAAPAAPSVSETKPTIDPDVQETVSKIRWEFFRNFLPFVVVLAVLLCITWLRSPEDTWDPNLVVITVLHIKLSDVQGPPLHPVAFTAHVEVYRYRDGMGDSSTVEQRTAPVRTGEIHVLCPSSIAPAESIPWVWRHELTVYTLMRRYCPRYRSVPWLRALVPSANMSAPLSDFDYFYACPLWETYNWTRTGGHPVLTEQAITEVVITEGPSDGGRYHECRKAGVAYDGKEQVIRNIGSFECKLNEDGSVSDPCEIVNSDGGVEVEDIA
jgi:hypothetical protein